jgi:hypothetical protein
MVRSDAQQPSSVIPFPVIGQIARKIRIVQVGVLLLLAVPVWLTMEAMAPQIVRAYTARVDLALDRLQDENYETVLRRAEVIARAATQRSFDQDILITDVSVIVSVQNSGAIVPVFTLEVTRDEWRKRPDPQIWATYYRSARALLFLEPNLTDPTPANPSTTAQPPALTPVSKVDPGLILPPTQEPQKP